MFSFDNRNDSALCAAVNADIKQHMTAFRYLMALTFFSALLLRFFLPLENAVEAVMATTTTLDGKSERLLMSFLVVSAIFGTIRKPRAHKMAWVTANFVAGTIMISSALIVGFGVGLGTGEAFFMSVGGAASSSWQEIILLFAAAVLATLLVILAVLIVLLIGNLPIAYYGRET
ncbi:MULTISPECIES: hypothetical protein [Agrobacterium]|uniref:hypothetical protein n=1 Tax=Agrobacterium TaxID=357 RepID=UPI003BA1456E